MSKGLMRKNFLKTLGLKNSDKLIVFLRHNINEFLTKTGGYVSNETYSQVSKNEQVIFLVPKNSTRFGEIDVYFNDNRITNSEMFAFLDMLVKADRFIFDIGVFTTSTENKYNLEIINRINGVYPEDVYGARDTFEVFRYQIRFLNYFEDEEVKNKRHVILTYECT